MYAAASYLTLLPRPTPPKRQSVHATCLTSPYLTFLAFSIHSLRTFTFLLLLPSYVPYKVPSCLPTLPHLRPSSNPWPSILPFLSHSLLRSLSPLPVVPAPPVALALALASPLTFPSDNDKRRKPRNDIELAYASSLLLFEFFGPQGPPSFDSTV